MCTKPAMMVQLTLFGAAGWPQQEFESYRKRLLIDFSIAGNRRFGTFHLTENGVTTAAPIRSGDH
jgi:hypothetical protein